MKVTFILKNLSDAYFAGTEGRAIVGLDNLPDAEKFHQLVKESTGDLRHCVSMKIGTSNQFRDRVELNQLLRASIRVAYKREPRKGYWLVTCEVTKA